MKRLSAIFLVGFLIHQGFLLTANAQWSDQAADHKRISTRIQQPAQNQASRTYDVLHYNIDLTINPNPFYLQGRVTIRLLSPDSPLEQITLDQEGLQVDSVYQDGFLVTFTSADEGMNITPVSIISAGDSTTFTIVYQGTPQAGLYLRQNFTGDTVLYSHNEPYDARFWFPCKDDPADKATHTVSIRLPAAYKVISNGRKTGEYPDSPGWLRTVWQEDYPIATYLISLAAAPYYIVKQNWLFATVSMPVEYYVYPTDTARASEVLTATTDMLSFFSGTIGMYPFSGDKYDMVETPLREASAMENQTATTMRDAVLDNKEVIAHELAHQWWGDALTPFSFADIWLNEGFASYFDVLYTEYSAGQTDYINRMENYKSLLFQDGSLSYPVYNPPLEYLFGRSVYYKGAWILHMLRLELGADVFYSICRNYYEQHKYGTVTTSEFIRICETTSQTSLDIFFNQWLNYGGIPSLYLSWHQDNSTLTFTIQQLQTETIYDLQLEITIQGITHDSLVTVSCNRLFTEYRIPFSEPVQMVLLDPAHKVLQTNNTPVYYLARQTALVKIFPNPVHTKVSIVYETDRSEQIILEVWNILGEKVALLSKKKQNAGLYRLDVNNINLSSGTYFFVLRTAERLDVRKVVILK